MNNNDTEILSIDRPTGNYKITEVEDIKRFMFAGHAMFTLESTRTGKWFTYYIQRVEFKNFKNPESPFVKFLVKVLTGSDNEHSYTYMCVIKPDTMDMHFTEKSKITADAISFQALRFFISHLKKGSLFPEINFYHKGVCGKCGRTLTVPESVSSGLGPICRGYVEPTLADIRKKKIQKINVKLMKDAKKANV